MKLDLLLSNLGELLSGEFLILAFIAAAAESEVNDGEFGDGGVLWWLKLPPAADDCCSEDIAIV